MPKSDCSERRAKSISTARLIEMRRFINKYGSGNCWTGTLGEACTMIHELLKERGDDASQG